ncbi:MAG: 7-cyano-7-deazaguanine synthase [Isosphaeraceae bacterium]
MLTPQEASETRGDVAVLVSGGLDSAVLAVDLLGEFARVFPIHVRFGLRWEDAERTHLLAFLEAASRDRPGLMPLTVLEEPIAQVYGDHWSNAGRPGVPDALTDDDAVYLPGRNVLLAAKAAVWCRLRGIEALAFGILKGNPFPDGTPDFFSDLAGVLNRAMDGRLRILRPYERSTKSEVLRRGLGLPLSLTFSCLDPVENRHCGRCNKCEERRKAFQRLGVADQTDYASLPAALPIEAPSARDFTTCIE